MDRVGYYNCFAVDASRPNSSQIAQNQMVHEMNRMSETFGELGYFMGKIVVMNFRICRSSAYPCMKINFRARKVNRVKKTMDRGRNPESLRYAVPWVKEHRKHHEKFMLSKAYIQGYICIKITLASRHQHLKSDSRKLHINKNKNDSNLNVVFQYLHKRSIVKIGWIVVQSILIWTHWICVRSLLCTYLSYASIWKCTMPHLIPDVHIYFTSKILRYIQYFAENNLMFNKHRLCLLFTWEITRNTLLFWSTDFTFDYC